MLEDSLEFIRASGVSLLEVHQEVRHKHSNAQMSCVISFQPPLSSPPTKR